MICIGFTLTFIILLYTATFLIQSISNNIHSRLSLAFY